jgi:hypothetical protein
MSETENDYKDSDNSNNSNNYKDSYDDYYDDYDKEKFRDKSILEAVLDRERVLKTLQRKLEGQEDVNGEWTQVRLPIARDEVIAIMITSLGTIINSSNSFADIDPDVAKMMIYEKILEFEYLAVEEITIESAHFEAIINMCDHSLVLFLSSVEYGHLTNALKDIFSGSNNNVARPQETGFFKELFGEIKPRK